MTETKDEVQIESWKKIVKEYWKYLIFIALGIVGAIIGAIFVGRWFVIEAQAVGLVPQLINQWTVGCVITFLLHLLLWEFVIIGIPVIVSAIVLIKIAMRRVPEGETPKREPKPRDKRFRWGLIRGGFIFLTPLVWLFTVFNDNMWNIEFQFWNFDYLAFSAIHAIIITLVVVGIPTAIYAIVWINDIIEE